MLIPDSNVLLNSINPGARDHDVARRVMLQAMRGREAVGLAWAVLLSFLRVSTHPSVFDSPLSVTRAIGMVRLWLSAPPAVMIEPTRQHVAILSRLLESTGMAGNLVNDAHLAALALEHDATVVSFDRDFGRFAPEGVRWQLPVG